MIKVLVVDDSALLRKLLGQVFASEADFEVEYARDGLEALERIAAFDPDVVTLDVHMPRLDGLQTLDRIMLERPRPVVMISSLTTDGAEATLDALERGAVDFLPKPGGAVSLRMAEFAPAVLDKVRAAAASRPRLTHRLTERVRSRLARAGVSRGARRSQVLSGPATGDGLVLVGTSTGGPPALEALLAPIPAGFPWPILIVQHMPATFTGPLARRLDRLAELQVVEVVQPMRLEAGVAYIGQGDVDLVVGSAGRDLVAKTADPEPGYPWRPSTDRLVRTAMDHVPASQLIGVLMTGMGNDGAAAMTRLKAAGGLTIAEAEETAVVWGMPGELVKAGGAGYVEPLPRIARRVLELAPPCR